MKLQKFPSDNVPDPGPHKVLSGLFDPDPPQPWLDGDDLIMTPDLRGGFAALEEQVSDSAPALINVFMALPGRLSTSTATVPHFTRRLHYLFDAIDKSYKEGLLMLSISMHQHIAGQPLSSQKEVALGNLDEEIMELGRKIAAHDRPMFLRPNFEFNGSWKKYFPDSSFIIAWRRLVDVIRRMGANPTIVYCPAFAYTDPLERLLEGGPYFPGMDYVDWYGVDLLHDEEFNAALHHGLYDRVKKFIHDAVNIGLTSGISAETTAVNESIDTIPLPYYWNNILAPLFEFIASEPSLKGFIWANSDFGCCFEGKPTNGLLQRNRRVARAFAEQLTEPKIGTKTFINRADIPSFLSIKADSV